MYTPSNEVSDQSSATQSLSEWC